MIDMRALVTQAQAGNPDAFAQLYLNERGRVFGIVRRRVSDHHTAEDITSEVFLRAWKSLDAFEWSASGFPGWLGRIAVNLCIDHYKKASNHRSHAIDFTELLPGANSWLPFAEDRRTDPEYVTAANATTALLDAALAGLTHKQLQVLALRYEAGLSCAETAEALGKEIGAVKTLAARAQQKLRANHALAEAVTR